jgi:putative restriction endonuclease
MTSAGSDWLVRQATFDWLDDLRANQGEVLARSDLAAGFEWEGQRVPLLGPQGIFKPRVLAFVPLSITTVPPDPGKPRPYDDKLGEDGFIQYRYRGTNPEHRENMGLREAWRRQIPLIYFYGIVPGRYVAQYPVFIAGDDPSSLTFLVQVDQRTMSPLAGVAVAEGLESRREYITVAAKRRLHQEAFRERVLRAYRGCCAMCRLRHAALLDAAHIVPDSQEAGRPVVSNGLALCKLHHAAFDQNLVGVRPDLVLQVKPSVLRERDGPMLRHGLQGLHEQKLILPRRAEERPAPEFVEFRFEQFRAAC